jgi:hypothetical protein
VIHIKNGKIYYSQFQPSSQLQEPCSSTASRLAASLVPYCGKDESNSGDSDAAPPHSLDTPSLHEDSPSSPHNKHVLVCKKAPTKNNSKRKFNTNAGILMDRSDNKIFIML